jgi:hypothetical protein
MIQVSFNSYTCTVVSHGAMNRTICLHNQSIQWDVDKVKYSVSDLDYTVCVSMFDIMVIDHIMCVSVPIGLEPNFPCLAVLVWTV